MAALDFHWLADVHSCLGVIEFFFSFLAPVHGSCGSLWCYFKKFCFTAISAFSLAVLFASFLYSSRVSGSVRISDCLYFWSVEAFYLALSMCPSPIFVSVLVILHSGDSSYSRRGTCWLMHFTLHLRCNCIYGLMPSSQRMFASSCQEVRVLSSSSVCFAILPVFA